VQLLVKYHFICQYLISKDKRHGDAFEKKAGAFEDLLTKW
jgi:hypothetical protein